MEALRACITGIAGQDGVYLADLLRSKGQEVFGIDTSARPAHVPEHRYREVDLRDRDGLAACIRDIRPDRLYHLAAYHRSSAHPEGSDAELDEERLSIEVNLLSVQTILRTLHETQPTCRVFLAGSCHMFGEATDLPQTERTAIAPVNAYGITKAAAMSFGRMYRQRDGMFVCTGILYNHESPRRSPEFVTARLAYAAADAAHGKRGGVTVGNLEAQVDWGFAGDYVEAMRLMLEAETPEDFIISSGELHRVRDFAEAAFAHVGLDWKEHVREDAGVYRPVSRTTYHGDASAIRARLGWVPRTSFSDLVAMMVDHAMKRRDGEDAAV